eukprot:GHVU01092045.1.p1 GENE.GHVU01092045.1~~GHVU01092045.1.p1  ORF type:complete len:444 (+),score=117.91 GHVU01092045.1:3455-4786(+)
MSYSGRCEECGGSIDVADDEGARHLEGSGIEPPSADGGAGAHEQRRAAVRQEMWQRIIEECGEGLPFPLCEECLSAMILLAKQQAGELEAENAAMAAAIRELAETPLEERAQAVSDTTLKRISDLQARERELVADVAAQEAELEQLQQSRVELEDRLANQRRVEAALGAQFVGALADLQDEAEEGGAAAAAIRYGEAALLRISGANVIDDALHIWEAGPYGTINGFRLGRIGNQVSWEELNAALGLSCLLLHMMVRRLRARTGFHLLDFRLVPRGSFSQIIRLADGAALSLYADGSVARLFKGGKFDAALVGLLACVQQVCRKVQEMGSHETGHREHPPYSIEKDTVHKLSVRLQYSNDEKWIQWTRALKLMLIDVKWALSHLESDLRLIEDPQSPRGGVEVQESTAGRNDSAAPGAPAAPSLLPSVPPASSSSPPPPPPPLP